MGRCFPFLGNIILGEKAMRPTHILIAVFAVVVVLVLSQSPSISFSLALAMVLFFSSWRMRPCTGGSAIFMKGSGGRDSGFPLSEIPTASLELVIPSPFSSSRVFSSSFEHFFSVDRV